MYSSNVYKISWLHAISIGDFPSEFLEKRVGCFVSKNLKQSLWPYSATKWQGVFPSISLASTSAPEIKRVWMTEKCPLIQHMCKGVLKLWVLASITEPYSIKISTMGVIPSLDATCKGVQPSLFVQFIVYWMFYLSFDCKMFIIPILSPFSTANQSFLASSRRFFCWEFAPDEFADEPIGAFASSSLSKSDNSPSD